LANADPGFVGRITPEGVITEFTEGLTPNCRPVNIALGTDGNLWFTETAGKIGRITPGGVISEFSEGLTPGSHPMDIALGADGNLWFTEVASPGRIAKVLVGG
jgi:virginiamycin B lyase